MRVSLLQFSKPVVCDVLTLFCYSTASSSNPFSFFSWHAMQ